jgi:hypothetical protein
MTVVHTAVLLLCCPWTSQVEKGQPGLVEVLEAKGLDMVRRDWCPLSKDTGNYVLQQILSGAWWTGQANWHCRKCWCRPRCLHDNEWL